MKVNTKAYAVALYEIIKENKGEPLKTALANFVALLKKKNLLSLADKILADFSRYYNEKESIVAVTAETAQALTSEEKEKIIKNLKAALGKEIELINKTDKKLIGGMRLQIGDTLIDGSLQRRLNDLKTQLNS